MLLRREDARYENTAKRPERWMEVDETETDIVVAIIAAGATLLGGGALAAMITSHFQRKQHHREMLLPPAELFSEAAVKVFAQLRKVKPPRSRDHPNFVLLHDQAELERRLGGCEAALDELRAARGAVRIVFATSSAAVKHAGMTMYAQRLMLEATQQFYRDCKIKDLGQREPEQVEHLWELHQRQATKVYRALREESAWPALNQFSAEVRRHLHRARWEKPSALRAPKEPEKVLKHLAKASTGDTAPDRQSA